MIHHKYESIKIFSSRKFIIAGSITVLVILIIISTFYNAYNTGSEGSIRNTSVSSPLISSNTSNPGVINAPGPEKSFVSLKRRASTHLPGYPPRQAFRYLKEINDPSIVPSINKSHEIHNWTTLYNHVVKFLSLIGLSTTNFSITGLELTYYSWDLFRFNDTSVFCYMWKVFIHYTGEKWSVISVTFESLTGTVVSFKINRGPTSIYNIIEKNKWIVVNETRFLEFTRVPVIAKNNYTSYLNYMLYTLSLGRPQLYRRFSIVYTWRTQYAYFFQAYLNKKSIFEMSDVLPGPPLSTASIGFQVEDSIRRLYEVKFPIGLLIHLKHIDREPLITSSEAVEIAKSFLMEKFHVPADSIVVDRVCGTYLLVKPWTISNFWCVILAVYGVEVYHPTIYVDPVKGVVYDYKI